MHVKTIHMNTTPAISVNESTQVQLEWIMEEYGDMVLRLAYTYVKQTHIAEDISQEVFISCFKHLPNFKEKASYKTWIYRITVNKCKDYLRSWSFRNLFYRDKISTLIGNSVNSTESSVIDEEEKEKLFQKVLTLPIKLRETIILYYYEEFSIEEIASLLGVNHNTVKTRLHRARLALKGAIKEDLLDEK